MGVIIVSKREWARGLDSVEDFLIFKAVWLPSISYAFRIKGKMREDWKKQEGQILLKYKRKQEKTKRSNGCHLGEVDHCGFAEQLQPTNISIKPAALSQSLTNDTPGRGEVEGRRGKEKTVPCFILALFSPLLE